jgi:hypothetical protein
VVHESHFVLIFDSMDHVARIPLSLTEGEASHWVHANTKPSGYEDIAFNPREDRFYLLIEAMPADGGGFHAAVVEYDRDFVRQARHPLPFTFAGDNKGFEGLAIVRRGEQDYLLALCEGNRCRAGAAGREKGKGRIQIFQRQSDGWEHVGRIKLPPAVRFSDYSSLDIRDGRVAILSQETSEVWLGHLDPTEWRFVDDGHIWQLPRNAQGKPKYCNAEGVAWITADRLVIVSDRRKAGSPKRCGLKDQSVHVVQLGRFDD